MKVKNKNQIQDKDFVLIYEAKDNIDADLVRSLLESHNIQTFIQGKYHRGLLGYLGTYIPLRLLVPKSSAEKAKSLIKPREGESQDIKLRSLPTCFAACLALIAPGLCNLNAGNKKLAWLIGSMTFLSILTALIVRAVYANIQIVGFVITSLFSLIILDMVSGLLYRKEQIKKHSNILFAIVLIFSILWFPTLWSLVKEGAGDETNAQNMAFGDLRIDDFKFTDSPEEQSVGEASHPAVIKSYKPGEEMFFSLSFSKYVHGPAVLNAILNLHMQAPDGTTSETSSLELKAMPRPYVIRGAAITLPPKMSDGQYSLIFDVHDNDLETDTTYSVHFTVKNTIKN